jgi:hypothetical protein
MPVLISLGVVLGVLATSILASLVVHKRAEAEGPEAVPASIRESNEVISRALGGGDGSAS